MTITQTRAFESGCPVTTKTEIDIHHPRCVTFSRIINSRIYTHTVDNSEDDGPITISMVATMCKIDDNLFKTLSDQEMAD